jgi:hypothetical protein
VNNPLGFIDLETNQVREYLHGDAGEIEPSFEGNFGVPMMVSPSPSDQPTVHEAEDAADAGALMVAARMQLQQAIQDHDSSDGDDDDLQGFRGMSLPTSPASPTSPTFVLTGFGEQPTNTDRPDSGIFYSALSPGLGGDGNTPTTNGVGQYVGVNQLSPGARAGLYDPMQPMTNAVAAVPTTKGAGAHAGIHLTPGARAGLYDSVQPGVTIAPPAGKGKQDGFYSLLLVSETNEVGGNN